MQVTNWTRENESAGLSFLKSRYETSMFLLGNRETTGTTLGDHPNSANFKLLMAGNVVVAVFALSRRGNLLVSVDDKDVSPELIGAIVEASRTEGMPFKGVIGPWAGASAVHAELKKEKLLGDATFSSQELLYRLEFTSQKKVAAREPRCRLFTLEDYESWKPLRFAYMAEEGLKQDLTEDQLRMSFDTMVKGKAAWGYFDSSSRLVAMVGLNAKALDIGQVGGVFTVPEKRRQGLSRAAMITMMEDCRLIHGIQRMILFTGQKSFAAQGLYESLGYQRIGYFGLIFS